MLEIRNKITTNVLVFPIHLYQMSHHFPVLFLHQRHEITRIWARDHKQWRCFHLYAQYGKNFTGGKWTFWCIECLLIDREHFSQTSVERFGYQPFYIGNYNFYPTYAGVGIQKNAVINHSHWWNTPITLPHFQTFQLQVEDITRRLWEGGIPEKLIKYFIPLRFLKDEKVETPLEPFQVLLVWIQQNKGQELRTKKCRLIFYHPIARARSFWLDISGCWAQCGIVSFYSWDDDAVSENIRKKEKRPWHPESNCPY